MGQLSRQQQRLLHQPHHSAVLQGPHQDHGQPQCTLRNASVSPLYAASQHEHSACPALLGPASHAVLSMQLCAGVAVTSWPAACTGQHDEHHCPRNIMCVQQMSIRSLCEWDMTLANTAGHTCAQHLQACVAHLLQVLQK